MAISKIVTNSVDSGVTLTSPVMNTITSAAATALTLQSAGTTAITVDTSQNVGIGTSSPSYRLEVKGPSATAGQVSVRDGTGDTVTSGNTAVSLFFQARDTSIRTIAEIDAVHTTTNGTGGAMVFQTRIADVLAERMRIDASGNVLVNNTSTVYGKVTSQATAFNAGSTNWATSGAALSAYGSYGGGLVFIDGSAGYGVWVQDSGKDFYIRGNTIGTAPTGGVYLNDYATSWSAASDENVKDIIEPIENGLEKVSTLRAVIGKYKEEQEGKRHPFLIAQDVQAVLPESVSVMNKGEESECLGLSYTDVIPLLVASIKELKAIVDTQATRISALEAK